MPEDQVPTDQTQTPDDSQTASPVTVQYPSGHVVQFPSEAHANEHGASVWEQLKSGFSQAITREQADKTGSAFGQSVIDHVSKWHKDINDLFGEAGAELGRLPAEVTSGVQNFQAYMPSPYGQKPSMESVEDTAKREHPALSGVGEAGGRLAGTLSSPENVALLVAMPETKAIPLLHRAVQLAFAADMGSGVVANAKQIVNNWGKMTPQQRYSAVTSGALQSVLAGLAGIGAVGDLKGKVSIPSELKSEVGEAGLPGTVGPGGTPQVGSAAESAKDTQYFKEAKEENPKGSFSDWARISNEKKLAAQAAATRAMTTGPARELTAADKEAAAGAPDVNEKGQKLGVKPIEGVGPKPVVDKTGPDYNEKGQHLGVPPDVEDIGGKVRAELPPLPRSTGEQRANPRTPEQEQTANAFKQAVKELGMDATNEEIDKRMEELGVPQQQTLAGRMGSGIPEILKRLAKDETGSVGLPGTVGEQQSLDLKGEIMPAEEEDAPLWYSHAIDTINDKVQDNMTPQQVRGVLINAQVSPDEMNSTGLDKYLEGQKGKVSKPELQQFMKENQLQLREVNWGGTEAVEHAKIAEQHRQTLMAHDQLDTAMRNASYAGTSPVSAGGFRRGTPAEQQKWLEAMTPEIRSTALRYLQAEKDITESGQRATGLEVTPDKTDRSADPLFDVHDPNTGQLVHVGDRGSVNDFLSEQLEKRAPKSVKFPMWVHGKHWDAEGGLKATDYTEKLLMLPEDSKEELEARKAEKVHGDFVNSMKAKYEKPDDAGTSWRESMNEEEQGRNINLTDDINNARSAARNSSYGGGHFREAGQNLIGHARYGTLPELSDKRTMILHEVQSDYNTDLRAYGYKGELDEINKEIAQLTKQRIASGHGDFFQEIFGSSAKAEAPVDPELQAAQSQVEEFKARLKNGEKFTADEMSEFRAAQAKARNLQASPATSSEPTFTPEDQERLDKFQARKEALEKAYGSGKSPVPDAPLVRKWHEIILKRMLREAVDKGYERIVWPTGEQTADLYGVHHHIKSLQYDPYEKDLHVTQHDGQVQEHGVAPTQEALAEWMGPDLAKNLMKQIEDFKENNVTDESDEGYTDDQIYDMMAEPYSVEADDNEAEPYWQIHHDGEEVGGGEYYYSEREAQRAMEKWWEEEHPHHDIDTGEYIEPEEGEERTHEDDEEKGDIKPPELKEDYNEQEPSYSLMRDGEHIESFDTQRAAERHRERMISDDVDNFDGDRKGNSDKADKEDWPSLSNLDLHSGGEFHKQVQDTMIPSFLKAYTKKWGGKVGRMDVPNAGRPATRYSGPEVSLDTLEHTNSPDTSPFAKGVAAKIVDSMKAGKTFGQAVNDYISTKDASGKSLDSLYALGDFVKRFGGELKRMPQAAPMNFMDVTPQMKRALTKGKGQRLAKKDEPLQNQPQEQNA